MVEHSPLDELLAALAEPTRRLLVERLSRSPASTGELARPFDMSLQAVVQHLQALEAAGIVASEKLGRTRTYQLRPGGLDRLATWISDRRSLTERRLDRLQQHLEESNPSAPTTDRKDDK